MVLDSQNMLQVIKDFPKQCMEALSLPKGTSVSGEISNIVVTGMGGSAIGGDLLKIYLSNTNIPAYVKKAKIIGIASGGKLADECNKVVKVPSGLQPRAALGYLFFPMLGILHNTGIIRVKN